MTFAIQVDPDTLHRTGAGSITGRLSVLVETEHVPAERWDDFVVVVPGWWIRTR